MLGIIFLFCLVAGSALADGENLILNGDFEQMAATELPTGWTYSSWLSDVSTFTVYNEGYDGGNCIGIVNSENNDARFEQTVSVKPDTYYHISAYIYAEQCGDVGVAAVISVADSFAVSNMVRNSYGWEKAELYGKTTEDQTSITIQCRLGWYGMESTGVAYFDQVEMEELTDIPSGVMLQTFDYSNSDYYSAEIAPYVVSPTASPADSKEEQEIRNIYSKWVVVGVLATLAVLLGGSYLKHGDQLPGEEGKRKLSRADLVFIIGLGLALLLRFLIAWKVSGYKVDINCFMGWASRMAEVGPADFYLEGFCDYPPLYMLFLGINGLIAKLFGFGVGTPFILLNKVFPILCDLILSAFLYAKAKEETQENMAAFLGLAYAFLPAVLINASAWGQIDSVLVLLAVLCLYYMAKEKMYLSTLYFALGIMVKPQMLMFGPVFLIGFILYIVKHKKEGWKDLGLCFLEGLGIVLAVYIPCTI
ncbi:MAG: glycosyltransferase family 39 protein, partial [Clostridia bacterium]|nr:glycosyltransferase family 39 protein [Clostridia bacterium]